MEYDHLTASGRAKIPANFVHKHMVTGLDLSQPQKFTFVNVLPRQEVNLAVTEGLGGEFVDGIPYGNQDPAGPLVFGPCELIPHYAVFRGPDLFDIHTVDHPRRELQWTQPRHQAVGGKFLNMDA